jgi:hypothetical protein
VVKSDDLALVLSARLFSQNENAIYHIDDKSLILLFDLTRIVREKIQNHVEAPSFVLEWE